MGHGTPIPFKEASEAEPSFEAVMCAKGASHRTLLISAAKAKKLLLSGIPLNEEVARGVKLRAGLPNLRFTPAQQVAARRSLLEGIPEAYEKIQEIVKRAAESSTVPVEEVGDLLRDMARVEMSLQRDSPTSLSVTKVPSAPPLENSAAAEKTEKTDTTPHMKKERDGTDKGNASTNTPTAVTFAEEAGHPRGSCEEEVSEVLAMLSSTVEDDGLPEMPVVPIHFPQVPAHVGSELESADDEEQIVYVV